MRDIWTERREKKSDRRKLSARIRRLTRHIVLHYLSLSLSLFIGMLALFAFLNTDASWRGPMLILDFVSLILVLTLLLSGASK